jgi:menaquinone-9 beta-reductase
MSFDVIVVGAGPAGSVCSRHLARQGLSVLLIDKAQFPRPKICGDCLTPRCWTIWQEEDLLPFFQNLPHYPITNFLLSQGQQHPLRVTLPSEYKQHRAISRTVMDDWLLKEAQAAGVQVHQSTRIQEMTGPTSVLTDRGEFHAQVLIGADGRNSWVARSSGIPPGKALCRRVAWQSRCPALTIEEGVHMKFFDQGYLGTVRHNNLEANVCVVLNQPCRITPQEIAARYLGIDSALAWKSVTPLSRQAGPVAKGRTLLIGDAARIIEPFTGEGTYMAMKSGQLAAQCVSHALKENRLSDLASDYSRKHRDLYQQMPFHNRLTRWMAWHPKLAQVIVRLLQKKPELVEQLVYSNLYQSS